MEGTEFHFHTRLTWDDRPDTNWEEFHDDVDERLQAMGFITAKEVSSWTEGKRNHLVFNGEIQGVADRRSAIAKAANAKAAMSKFVHVKQVEMTVYEVTTVEFEI